MTPDQLQDAEWTPEMWDSLNELARKVVEANAQLRKLIPRGPDAPNAYSVVIPKFESSGGVLELDVTKTIPVTRIRYKLRIKSHQLHDIEAIKLLVTRAAESFAHLEDRVLARGETWKTTEEDCPQKVEPAEGNCRIVGDPPETEEPGGIIEALIDKANEVHASGASSTLHAVAGQTIRKELVAERVQHSRRDGIERAKQALGSPASQIVFLPLPDKLARSVTVFPASPATLDLVWAQPVRLAYVGTNDGDLELRLEEAFCLRTLDGKDDKDRKDGKQIVTFVHKAPA